MGVYTPKETRREKRVRLKRPRLYLFCLFSIFVLHTCFTYAEGTFVETSL